MSHNSHTPIENASETGNEKNDRKLAHLAEILSHAAHLLPAQGPITTFVHHNPLHLFESKPFHEALLEADKIFGSQMYLSEERYHDELKAGRILFSDVREILESELGSGGREIVIGQSTRFDIQSSMLRNLPFAATEKEAQWFIANSKRLEKIIHPEVVANSRNLNLVLDLCIKGTKKVAAKTNSSSPARFREVMLEVTGQDPDLLVNDLLFRFSSAFLDQGFAIWDLPRRDSGFIEAFRSFAQSSRSLLGSWARNLPENLELLCSDNSSPLEMILASLEVIGVPEENWEEFLTQSLLAVRGWAGMIWQIEVRPDKVPHPIKPGNLAQFLAIRLLLDRLAMKKIIREFTFRKITSRNLKDELANLSGRFQARQDSTALGLEVFCVALDLGWEKLIPSFTHEDWARVVSEVDTFTQLDQRKIFHLAYEKYLYRQVLDSLVTHKPEKQSRAFSFQAVFCIDEREESLRRHLEEIDPSFETYGAAGFFNVPMYYKATLDSFYTPLCPIIITPTNWVQELPEDEFLKAYQTRASGMKTMQIASHKLHLGSRGGAVGAVLSASLGVLASIPLAMTVLFPRLTAKIRRYLTPFLRKKIETKLKLERFAEKAGPSGNQVGFSLNEMAAMGERFLRDTGLTRNFCRLVFIFGHGSTSINNPHQSAYDCGACGGSPGGANARALAQILNDKRVRSILQNNGIIIPDDTCFLGGLSNTSINHVSFFDRDLLPATHHEELEKARNSLREACMRNAHERCRRFQSAPLDISLEEAQRHVEGRAEDLAQPRPELGHATNAFCIVGRRERTRGIYLDRRAFLVSYDPTQDNSNHDILNRILNAAMPVCSGINLEFFFSQVDPTGWGCGTKLPHNPTSYLGVMDGAASDLRTGLPWQVVEIHEAVRLLFIIETTPEIMLKILNRCPPLANLCFNQWINLVVLDPDSPRASILKGREFVPYEFSGAPAPVARSSIEWYRGKRNHLGYPHISSLVHSGGNP
ncbi:MAG: DUF2309 domain-containing protein [Gemmataceae bacterium]